jgi:hypothetical protein
MQGVIMAGGKAQVDSTREVKRGEYRTERRQDKTNEESIAKHLI